MAIYRSVHTSFWTDSKVADDMSSEDRYIMLYLMTNPYANQVGCYEISKRQISYETGYTIENIDKILKKLENELKVIKYCDETKELLIVNWWKYNWTTSPKVKSCILKEFQNIKSLDFKGFLATNVIPHIYPNDTLSIPYRYPMDTHSQEKEKEKEKEKNNKNKNNNKKKIILKEKVQYGEFGNVSLTEQEYSKLIDEFGTSGTLEIINILDTYKGSSGKKYVSDYLAIKNWVIKRWQDDKQKNKNNRQTTSGNPFSQLLEEMEREEEHYG